MLTIVDLLIITQFIGTLEMLIVILMITFPDN